MTSQMGPRSSCTPSAYNSGHNKEAQTDAGPQGKEGLDAHMAKKRCTPDGTPIFRL